MERKRMSLFERDPRSGMFKPRTKGIHKMKFNLPDLSYTPDDVKIRNIAVGHMI